MLAVKRGIRSGLFALQLSSLLLVACAQTSVEEKVVADEISSEVAVPTPSYLEGKGLRIWSKVDTAGTNRGVVKAIRTFFDQKMQKLSAEDQDFWVLENYEQFRRDYSEIRYAEYDSGRAIKFWPTLLNIAAVDGHEDFRFATVRWASLDSLGAPDEVRYVFQFLVKPNAKGDMRLTAPTEVLTEVWKRERVGEVTFVLSPKHKFSRKQAEQQQASLKKMGEFFEVDPFPITFYSFHSPTELLQMRGYVKHPLFYTFETGGQAGAGNVVYSGNDRDEYVHEIAHLFISRAVPTSSGILNEGLATLLGGSTGQPYEWHLKKLKAWLIDHPDVDLTNYLNPYQSQYIEEDTSIPYTIGAVLCDKLLEEHGKEELFEALALGKNPWAFLAELGIEKGELRSMILNAISD